LQDAAAAISGSGPAYAALFIDALARAGVRQGLTRVVAQKLAVQTLKGTALLLENSGMHPEELVDGVASPRALPLRHWKRLRLAVCDQPSPPQLTRLFNARRSWRSWLPSHM